MTGRSDDRPGEIDPLRTTAERAQDDQRMLHERLAALTSGAEAMLAAVEASAVRDAICDLARRISPADAIGIWTLDAERGEWRVACQIGLGDPFTGQVLSGGTVPFDEPLIADDLDSTPLLEERRQAYRAEGIQGLISVPLPILGERRATLVFYYRTPHRTSEAERQIVIALGHLAAAALGRAEAFEEQRRLHAEAQRQSARLAFLAEASSIFGSLDYQTTLRQVAQLAVPRVADWCAVDVLNPEGTAVERLAIAHADPDKVRLAEALQERYPTDLDSDRGVALVLRTGAPTLFAEVTDDMVLAWARDAAQLALLRSLSLQSLIIAPLNARGRTLGAITWVHSTPGRRFSEEDLALLMDVARRAALAIDNARLYAEAQRANHMKDEFLAVLSHELRTPLNTILGWSKILLGGDTTEATTRKGLEAIERNARGQGQLVDDLLNFARLGTGQIGLERERFDIRDTIADLGAETRPAAAQRGITMTVTMPDTPCEVDADPQRVRQVVSNLLSNAMKFTGAGGTIAVTVHGGAGIEVSVTDSGAGIDPAFLPHVFERFRQGDPSTTRSHGGLGLGLAIVREFTELQGGSVEARSDGIGRGSTFTIRFPRAGAAPPTALLMA